MGGDCGRRLRGYLAQAMRRAGYATADSLVARLADPVAERLQNRWCVPPGQSG
jgi:hypothetical protein